MKPLLQIEDLTVTFARPVLVGLGSRGSFTAVDHVGFYVNQSETVGLVGESGCGKTTTARAIMRLIEPAAGQIYFEDINILSLRSADMRRVRRRLQMVFQDPFTSLNPLMRIGESIAEPLLVHRLASGNRARQMVVDLLEAVGLPSTAYAKYPREFSGGQRQRIGIARALASDPMLIICDEPTSSLDVSVQAQIVSLLRDLQARKGLAYLFISHDLPLVRAMSHRVVVMYLGEVVEVAPTDALFAHPAHPYTRALLASIPVPDPIAERERQLTTTIYLKAAEVPSIVAPPRGCRFHTRCPFAAEICVKEAPKLREMGPGQLASCHFGEQIMALATPAPKPLLPSTPDGEIVSFS